MEKKQEQTNTISPSLRSVINSDLDKVVKEVKLYIPRIVSLREDLPEYFDNFPDDLNLKVEHIQEQDLFNNEDIEDIYDVLSVYYENKFMETDKKLKPLLELIKLNYQKDHDINWFIQTITRLITELDPYFDELGDPPYEYQEKIGDLIIEILKDTSKENFNKVTSQIYSDYLNPNYKDMYTYTMGIVIDTLLGKRKFNKVYRKRLLLELEKFDLDDYTKQFYKNVLKELNKELGYS